MIDFATIGQRWPREMTITEEPKSLGCVVTRKHKVYSITDANPISSIKPIDDTAQSVEKHAKTTTTSSSHVRFDGVILRPMRRSACATKTNSKKELFTHLSQEYATIIKTYEDLSEAFD